MALARRAGAGARWLAARPLAALFLVYLVVVIGFVVPRITADGVAYYAEARSILFDGDLDLANEYALDSQVYSPLSDAGPRAFLPRDELGRFQHNVNVGIVVLFAPFLLVAHGIAFLLNLVGLATPMDGYAQVYVLALSFGTSALLAAAVALMVSYGRTLVGPGIALAGGVAAWLGTSVFYWAVFRPAHAHAPAVLLEALFVVLFLSRARRVDDRLAWFLLGAVGGLMLTVRPVTGLYAAVPAAYLVLVVLGRLRDAWRAERAGCRPGRPGDEGRRSGSRGVGAVAPRSEIRALGVSLVSPAIAGLLFLAGSFLGRLPQFAFARDLSLFGTSFYSDSGYLDDGLAGTPLDGVASLVVHPLQGNLWWAPLVPLSLIGLAAFWRRDRLTALAGVAWAALIWGFVSLLGVPERFGGFGLESRHLVEATPVYMLGAMGLLALGRDAVRALLRLGRLTLARTVALAAGFGMVAVVAWNVLAHVASLIIQVAGASPAERVLRLLARPPVLGRLYLDRATLEAPEGRVF
nr:hypothetical protein [Chloroflexota bacterium]